jgi:hypothetical protein
MRDNPEQFRDKPFKVFINQHGGQSDEALRGLEEARAEYRDTGGRSTLECYESWRVPGGTFILDFDWNPSRQSARLDGMWKILSDRPFRRLKGTSITLCAWAPTFEGLSLAKEKVALAKAATVVMRAQGKNELTVTGEEFGRLLAGVI